MDENKLKSFVGNVIDHCTDSVIRARSIARQAYGKVNCPDELLEMPKPAALETLRTIAAEVLRDKDDSTNPTKNHTEENL